MSDPRPASGSRIDPRRIALVTFDCYGTLIDWESGILRFFRALLPRTIGEEAILRMYARFEREAEAGEYRAYADVLGEVTRKIGREIGRAMGPGDARQLARELSAWTPFPEVPASLARLKERVKIGVVSNIDRNLFEASRARLGVELDLLATAEDVRAYKPSEAPFRRMLDEAKRLGVDRDRVLHVAESRYHDIEPCSRLGIACVWVNRSRGRAGATPEVEARADATASNLGEVADLVCGRAEAVQTPQRPSQG